MTEAEWLAATDPTPILELVRDQTSERKLRLFACACCRSVWQWLWGERSHRAIEIAEVFADGLVTLDVLNQAQAQAEKGLELFPGEPVYDPAFWACAPRVSLASGHCNWYATSAATKAIAFGQRDFDREAEKIRQHEEQRQAVLARDILGNPFRPVAVDPDWRTSTVVALARGIYDDRAFDRLPILADALQDAGCEHPDILTHLRGDGSHVRGCWALDLVLGKE